MQNNFLKYIQKNGPEAFDKMAADLAKQLNDAKAQYEADQKKKAEEAKLAEGREAVKKQLGRLMKFYYGADFTMDPDKAADVMLAAVDAALKEQPKEEDVMSRLEVVKDEELPGGGHVKVMRGDLSDLSDEELRDFWNNVHETFFKV